MDELLGVLQAPGDHRPPRAVQRDVGAGPRIAGVRGDARQLLDRHVGAGDVVELEQQVDLPRARPDREVGVAGRVGQREELLRPDQAAFGGVGPVGGDVALVEDVGQRRRVVEVARDAERRLHQLLAALRGIGVVEGDGQAHEHARTERAAVGTEPLERLLEHGHEIVVDHARREPEAAQAERGAGQQAGVADAPCELDGGQERRPRGVAARLHLRLAAQEQQLAAQRLVGLGEQVEGGEGGIEEVGGALVGQRGERLVPCAMRMLERLGRIADRGRLDEVVRQLGLAGGGPFERLAHGGVQAGAAGGGQVAVERLADEAVDEAERAGRPRGLLQQLHRERLVEALQEIGTADPRRALERRELELAALDRGHLERFEDLRAQRQKAPADGVAHAVGQRQALAQRLVDAALGHQQAHDLVGVERVALGQRVQRVHELLGGVSAAAVDDQRAQVVVLEPAEVDAHPEARQLAEHRLELGSARRTGFVVGGDDEHVRLAHRPGQEGEQQQRRQVGGVEVVEEHDERLAGGGVAQEDGDGVEEGEARLLGLEVAGLGEVQALAQLGGELGHPARPGAELDAQRVVVAVGRDRAHDLHPGPEGGRAAAVPSARPRDAVALGRRALAQRGGQARLADARLAREQHEGAVPGRRPRRASSPGRRARVCARGAGARRSRRLRPSAG